MLGGVSAVWHARVLHRWRRRYGELDLRLWHRSSRRYSSASQRGTRGGILQAFATKCAYTRNWPHCRLRVAGVVRGPHGSRTQRWAMRDMSTRIAYAQHSSCSQAKRCIRDKSAFEAAVGRVKVTNWNPCKAVPADDGRLTRWGCFYLKKGGVSLPFLPFIASACSFETPYVWAELLCESLFNVDGVIRRRQH